MSEPRHTATVERFVDYVEADCDRDEPRAKRLAQEMVEEDGLDPAFLELRDQLTS